MKDLKSSLKINKNAVETSEIIQKLAKYLPENTQDIIKLLEYSDEKSALENFLLYRFASSLYQDINDADCTLKVKSHFKNALENINEVASVENYNKRAFKVNLLNKQVIYLETDTANSLMGDLGDFLRAILEKNYKEQNWAKQTYQKRYELLKNCPNKYYMPYRNFYFYQLIKQDGKLLKEKINKIDEKESALKCLKALEIRASKMHTIENMMLVVYGYNCFRGLNSTYSCGKQISDRIDLTLIDYKQMLEDDKLSDEKLRKRLGNNIVTRYSLEFLMKNLKTLAPVMAKDVKLTDGRSIKQILQRTNEINYILKK